MICSLALSAPPLLAQSRSMRPMTPPGIVISPTTHISADAPTTTYFESFLTVNPRNPQNLLALATSVVTVGREIPLYAAPVYASFDGGRTWQRSRTMGPDTTSEIGTKGEGDPIIYFGRDGAAYLLAITEKGCLARRSMDGGRT